MISLDAILKAVTPRFLRFTADHRIDLTGKPSPTSLGLSARQHTDDGTITVGELQLLGMTVEQLEAEYLTALAQEILADLIQGIFTEARRARPNSAVWDSYPKHKQPDGGLGEFRGLFDAALDRAGVGGIAVVSPTALTILQSCSGASLVQIEPETRRDVPVCDYNQGRGVVAVDQYACDSTPVLFCQKGWAKVGFDFLVADAGTVPDPRTQAPVHTYRTNLGVQIDPTKIELLGIKTMSMGFI